MNAPLRQVRVAYREQLFTGEVKVFGCAPGLSIAQMLAEMPAVPPLFQDYGSVRINDVPIPREMWDRVRPKADSDDHPVIVTLHVSPGNSGTLRTIAAVAVLAAAVIVSAGALAPVFGAAFAAGGIGAITLSAGISLAGALAISALTPPPSLGPSSSALASGSGATATGSTFNSASLSGNVLVKGRSAPRSIGTNLLFPPLACEALVQNIGGVEVAEATFVLAGPHLISQILIGNTPIADMANVTYQINDGTNPLAFQNTLITRQGATDAIAVDMDLHKLAIYSTTLGSTTLSPLLDQGNPNIDVPVFRVYATRDSPDEVWVSLVFASGLYYTPNPAQYLAVPFRIQMRQKGTTTWINLPEVHFTTQKTQPLDKVIQFTWGAAPAQSSPPSGEGAYVVYHACGGQGQAGPPSISPATAIWNSDGWFLSGGANNYYDASNFNTTSGVANVRCFQDSVIFYLGGATFPQGVWEIAIQQGAAYQVGLFNPHTYQYQIASTPIVINVVLDWFYFVLSTTLGQYVQFPDLIASQYQASIPRVANVWNQHPIQTPDFAQIAVKATGQALQQLSCIASGYVADWNGSAWTGLNVTSNPAPHFRDILTGSANVDPVPTSMIDDPTLVAWRARCAARGYQANAVLEGQSVLDCLNVVAAAGYGKARQSEKWGVVQDFDRTGTAPVQVFSSRTMNAFSFQKAFPKRPDGLRVTYRDASNNYAVQQIEVPDPAVVTPLAYQEVPYDSLTSASAVQERALFDIAQAKLRNTFYVGITSIENIVAVRGDLVAVQHDILSDYAGFARVSSITRSGGRITQIVLDGTIPGPNLSGNTIGIAIRLLDGTVWIQPTSIANSVPLDPGSSLAPDCLVVSGTSGSEYKRLIVYSVLPQADMQAQITFVDEAPTLPFP
jgi:hypothetical protein